MPGVQHFSSEPILTPAMLGGGSGSYSSFIYACPHLLTELYRLCVAHAWDEAMGPQRRFNEFVTVAIGPIIARGYIDPPIDKLLGHVSGVLSGGIDTRRPYATVEPARWHQRKQTTNC